MRRWYLYSLWAIFVLVLVPVGTVLWYPNLPEIRKGYLVLGVTTVVTVVTFALFFRLIIAVIVRRPMQYSLRSLLVLTAIVAACYSWLGAEKQWAKRQKDAVAALRSKGTVNYSAECCFCSMGVNYERREPATPEWVENLLRTDFFDTMDLVRLTGPEVTDTDLELVAEVRGLRLLCLHQTNTTAAGRSRLQRTVPRLIIDVRK
jgi:predicted small integral membrane protein